MVFYEIVLPVTFGFFLSYKAQELFLHALLPPHTDVWIVAFLNPPFYPCVSYLTFKSFVLQQYQINLPTTPSSPPRHGYVW
jgi:hypothetical protein